MISFSLRMRVDVVPVQLEAARTVPQLEAVAVVSAVAATRFSPTAVSLMTPISMVFSLGKVAGRVGGELGIGAGLPQSSEIVNAIPWINGKARGEAGYTIKASSSIRKTEIELR